MPIPLQITFRDISRSEALDTKIRERAASLERFHPRITSCRITVGEVGKHRQQGREFEVSVDIRVPGRTEIVSNLHRDQDIYVALRDAFDSAIRQLEDIVREKRGDTKTHETP